MVVRVREDPRLRGTVRAEISTDRGRKLFDKMFGPFLSEVQ